MAGSVPPYEWGIMVRRHTPFDQAHKRHGCLIKRMGQNRPGPFKSFSVFKAAADFPAEWIDVHINVKETFALHEVLRLLVAQYPDHLRGTTLVVCLDNTTMFHAFRKGRARDERMRDLIKSRFWLQVDSDLTLKLKWVCSADNKDADDLT